MTCTDPTSCKRIVDETRARLRDLMFVVDVGPFTDGEFMAARWIATGSTERGPTRFTGNDLLRVAGGEVVEYWYGASPA